MIEANGLSGGANFLRARDPFEYFGDAAPESRNNAPAIERVGLTQPPNRRIY